MPRRVRLFRAAYSYDAANHDELSLKEGDVVRVEIDEDAQGNELEGQTPGWCVGRANGASGMVPRNYLKAESRPEPRKQQNVQVSPPSSVLSQHLSPYSGPAAAAKPPPLPSLTAAASLRGKAGYTSVPPSMPPPVPSSATAASLRGKAGYTSVPPSMPPPVPSSAAASAARQRSNAPKTPVKTKSYTTNVERALKVQRYTNMRGIKTKQTRYMIWAHNIAIVASAVLFAGGIMLVTWKNLGDVPIGGYGLPHDDPKEWTSEYDGIIAGICCAAGAAVFAYETSRRAIANSGIKKRGQIFRHAVGYFFVAVPGALTLPTLLGCVGMLISSAVYFKAYHIREQYNPPRKRAKHMRSRATTAVEATIKHRLYVFFGGKDVATRWFRFLFICGYIAANAILGITNAISALDSIKDAQAGRCDAPNPWPERTCVLAGARALPGNCCGAAFTKWVSGAKFFGALMNLNFSLLLLPVSRSVITYLYNHSTGDQTTTSQIFRSLLKIVPIDQSLELHKLCGWVGMFGAAGHTVCHLMNYAQAPFEVFEIFGVGIWLTGIGMLVIILMIATTVQRRVKRDHHELFMYTHMLYMPFLLMIMFHGKGWIGPKYWKYFLVPGGVYFLDKCYRHFYLSKECTVLGLTCMSNDVLVLRVDADSGPFRHGYKVGQYCFLKCPHASGREWHPFTISSAPESDVVTFHIRVMGADSWTWRLRQFMKHCGGAAVEGSGASFSVELQRFDKKGRRVNGKVVGPDGQPLLIVYGPHSAPTQHLTEYNEVLVCTTGIGVTPLASSMSSIVLHRWRLYSGKKYPDRATFVWCCSHKDVQSFRWLVKLAHTVQGALYSYASQRKSVNITKRRTMGSQRVLLGGNMHFAFHIFITSVPKDRGGIQDILETERHEVVQNPEAFWGIDSRTDNESEYLATAAAPFEPFELYEAMMNPRQPTEVFGCNLFVHQGRPSWDPIFEDITRHTEETDIGVTFCGNPAVGKGLLKACGRYHRPNPGPGERKLCYHMHKEVF